MLKLFLDFSFRQGEARLRLDIGIRGKFRSSEILRLARKTIHQTVMQKITYHHSPILSSAVQGCSKPLVGFHFYFDFDSSI